jgi:hypothetical protein
MKPYQGIGFRDIAYPNSPTLFLQRFLGTSWVVGDVAIGTVGQFLASLHLAVPSQADA